MMQTYFRAGTHLLSGVGEAGQGAAESVLEHQRGFEVYHLFPGGEVIEHEIAQVLGVGDAEVHQEIILATHVKQADHLGQRQYGIAKRIYDLPAVARQLQGDHGLDRKSVV